MSKNITLVSNRNMFNQAFEDHLKLCYLWYDEVLLENFGKQYYNYIENLNINNRDAAYLTDILIPLEKRVPKCLVEEYKNNVIMAAKRYPRWKDDQKWYNTYRQPKNAEEYAHNAIIKNLENEYGMDDEDYMYYEGTAASAIDNIKLWKMVNLEIPCILQADKYEKIAMEFLLFDKEDGNRNETFRLFEISIPSLVTVPWSKIVELRKNNDFSALRDKLEKIMRFTSGNLEDARKELNILENQAMENILDEFKPDIKNVALEIAVANIPISPVNPASIFLSGRDLIHEVIKKNKYDWFYLLRNIRKSVNNHF